MGDPNDPGFQLGKWIASVAVGAWCWMSDFFRGPRSQGSTEHVPASQQEDQQIWQCYAAFARGMKNRRMSYVAMELLRANSIAMSEDDIALKTQANVPEEWSPAGVQKVIRDLLAADFIQITNMPRYYKIRPNAATLLIDCESLLSTGEMKSSVDSRTACFEAIVRFVERSNTMQHVLQVLKVAERPLSAFEVFQRAKALSERPISSRGVEKLLRDLRDDPFVEETSNGLYSIHQNGRTLLEYKASRLR